MLCEIGETGLEKTAGEANRNILRFSLLTPKFAERFRSKKGVHCDATSYPSVSPPIRCCDIHP
jgi:hypothetical protein